MEKQKRKRGRPPKIATQESRVEQALRGKVKIEEEKRPIGRPRLDYEDRPEHIRFVIDCAALGYSPSRITALLKEKYGELDDRVLSINTINGYRKRYFSEIQKREKELRSELPIILPSMRIRYLQRVVDEALDGVSMVAKDGSVYTKKDHNAVIQAVKEINSMQRDLDEQRQTTAQEMSIQREVEEQKEAIRQHVVEQVEITGRTAIEILKDISEGLSKDYPEAVQQLTSEYRM